jgi:DNA-binding CsgD family transcriptional regulator
MTAGYLASVLFLVQDIPAGEKVLDAVLSPDTPAETMTQRMLWCAAAELALLKGQLARALEILARFADPAIAGGQKSQSLRVLKLRGETLFALQRLDEAEVAWKAAQELASAQGVRPVQWRLSLALGNLYLAQRRGNEAEQSFTAARALIAELADTLADEALRAAFVRQAMAMFPRAPSSSPKQAFAGLTSREREVALLIAQGKSNQMIADTLVVTRRTVETHIGNIMFKLGCTSRTQIAVWVVKGGLLSENEASTSP